MIDVSLRALESAGMAWLDNWGIPTPKVVPAPDTLEQLESVLDGSGPWVIKPNTAVGGKGLRGLISVCETADEARAAIERLRESGESEVLIAGFVEGSEFYFSITLDEQSRRPIMRLATEGGVGFDAASQAASVLIDPALGLLESDVNQLLLNSGMITDRVLARQVGTLAHRAWRAFVASEATMVEVNPFRRSERGPIAVGIALEFDENANATSDALRPRGLKDSSAFRVNGLTAREELVARTNHTMSDSPAISFIELGGDISVLVSGGGAALLCMDRIHDLGLAPACYIDSSPGAGPEKLSTLFQAGMNVPGIKGVLFGAAVISLDDVARLARIFADAAAAADLRASGIPVVTRLAGPNEKEAREILAAALPEAHILGRESTLEDACDLMAQLVGTAEPVSQN